MTKRAEPNPSTPTGAVDAGRSNVVALSRYRARLARGRRLRRPQELLESPEADTLIAQLPGDELYYVLRAADREDALQLLMHAGAEQVQTVLDFEIWDRDHLSRAAVLDWLDLLSHAPHEKIGEWLRGMDVELLALLLRKSCRIYDLTLEEAPDEPEGTLFPTPDGFFVLDAIGFRPDELAPADLQARGPAPDAVRAVLTLIDALYRTDLDFARRLLVGARAEQDSEMEEHAYRWRAGRMSDLGFIDYYEALEIYRELDPAAVSIGEEPKRETPAEHQAAEALRAPDALVERLMTESPFARAVAALTSDEEIAAAHTELIALANRVLAAERVTPGDEQAIAAAMEALSATLDLGVEFLARGDEERAVAAVRTLPLTTIFRTAISMTGKLRRLALALKRRNPFALGNAALDLFEDVDREAIAAVTRLRPLFPRILDEPPRGGQRPFGSLHDLALATAAVERAGASLALLFGLGVRSFHLTAEALGELSATAEAAIDAGVIARTAVVGRVLHDEAGNTTPYEFRTLTCADVKRWRELVGGPAEPGEPARLKEPLRGRALAVLRAAVPEQLAGSAEPILRRWFDSLAPLEPVLVRAR